MRLAQAQMQIGDFDMVAVGGVENMTQAPFCRIAIQGSFARSFAMDLDA